MKKEKTKIMVFGTFDSLHKGHLNFFSQAKKLAKNSSLVVSIARDANVKKIKKNKPLLNERQRLKLVQSCRLVDKAVLGGLKNYLAHIIKEKPEIIALGYDQSAYVKNLANLLLQKGLVVRIKRLKSFKPKIYKTSIFKRKI